MDRWPINPWILLCLLSISVTIVATTARAEDDSDFFERKIRPVLVERC